MLLDGVILGIAIFLLMLYAVMKYRAMFEGCEKVEEMFPGPPTWPILGNALEWLGDGHHAYIVGTNMLKKFRRSWRLWIGPTLYILVPRPAEAEKVLSSMEVLEKSYLYNFFIPWIGRGLLTSFGSRWKKHRKALTPTFHFSILTNFLDVFNKNSQVLVEILEKESGKSLDIQEYLKLHALDNICGQDFRITLDFIKQPNGNFVETAMGVSIDAQHNAGSEYVKSIKKMCEIVFKRTLVPWLQPDWMFQLFPDGWAQKKSLKIIHGLSRKVLDDRIQARQENSRPRQGEERIEIEGKRRIAFLDLLLDRVDDGTLSTQDVLEEIDTFMFEGHDTVTAAMSYACYNLAHFPDYQKRAFEEQVTIFGNDPREATQQDLAEMKYLEMFIKESLRLYPSVPIVGRVCAEDIQLDEYTYIPKNANVIIPILGMHRHPDFYENPEVFNPENFDAEVVLKRHPFAFIPFSAGPRNCIGMKFAMMELKSTLSVLLRNLEFQAPEGSPYVLPTCEVVIGSKTGFQVTIKKR